MSDNTVPISQGATVGDATPTVPIPQGASVGDYKPTSTGFWASVKARLQSPFSAGPMGSGDLQPDAKPPQGTYQTSWDQQKQVLKDSFNEMVDNIEHPSQLLHMLPGWSDVKDKVTPKEIDQIKSGDYSGATGTSLVDIANMFAGGKSALNPEAATPAVENASSAAVRGTAKATNAVLHNAPDVIPSAFVPPIVKKIASKVTVPGEDFGVTEPPPYDAAAVEARATATKARQQAASDLSDIPGNTAQPEQPVAAQPSAVPTAADRAAYLETIKAKRQAMGLTKDAVTEAPAAPALPSEDDVAKGMGYKSAVQAQQRLGPDQWQQTYQKIAKTPEPEATVPVTSTTVPEKGTEVAAKPSTPEDVVDAAVPPTANKALNMKTKAEVNFYVQKGDVEGAKAAIQNAANKLSPKPGTFADAQEDAGIQQFMRQDLQSQYGKGRLVEGREQAAGNSADRTKLAGIPKQGEQFATRLSRYPAPEGDMEANKMLGYDQHATPQPVATPSERPNEQPWGGLSEQDLTSILKKSVDLAKSRRTVQTK